MLVEASDYVVDISPQRLKDDDDRRRGRRPFLNNFTFGLCLGGRRIDITIGKLVALAAEHPLVWDLMPEQVSDLILQYLDLQVVLVQLGSVVLEDDMMHEVQLAIL